TMKANAQRELAFTYGLGRILGDAAGKETVTSDKGELNLLVGNRTAVDKPFIITAYVKSSAADKVTLRLPEGLALAEGQQAEQAVPGKNRDGYAQVTWWVKSSKTGKFMLEADAPGIGTAKEVVQVRERSLFE